VLCQIALIDNPSVIRRILSHLGLSTEVLAARPARPPPLPIGRPDTWYDDVVGGYWVVVVQNTFLEARAENHRRPTTNHQPVCRLPNE
jgi:hypothetical protein